ncbi:hypothetical protein Tco_1531418 [Tanacetum coccineum]
MENQSDVQNDLVEIQTDDHDLLVNYNNENDDMLGYESRKLYKFRRIWKTGGIKIKGDLVSWSNRFEDSILEEVDKNQEIIWNEYGRNQAIGNLDGGSKNVYRHKMGRGGYVFVKEKMVDLIFALCLCRMMLEVKLLGRNPCYGGWDYARLGGLGMRWGVDGGAYNSELVSLGQRGIMREMGVGGGRKRSPPTTPELFANSLNLSSLDSVPLVLS